MDDTKYLPTRNSLLNNLEEASQDACNHSLTWGATPAARRWERRWRRYDRLYWSLLSGHHHTAL